MSFNRSEGPAAKLAASRTVAELLDFGVVVADKIAGPTSHDVTSEVRRALGVAKAGHGGTLDPAVTGVLPVFLGRATRLSSLVLSGGKEYRATARFHGDLTDEELARLVDSFTGDIRQTPPVRSRVKREERTRTVHSIEVTGRRGRDVEMTVSCQAGTYIRKLIHDMGVFTGSGAHMALLRRTRAGPFELDSARTIPEMAEAYTAARSGDEAFLRSMVFPGEVMAGALAAMTIDRGAVIPVSTGAKLAGPGVLSRRGEFVAGDRVGLFAPDGTWIAIAEALVDSGSFTPGDRGLVAIPRRVLVALKG